MLGVFNETRLKFTSGTQYYDLDDLEDFVSNRLEGRRPEKILYQDKELEDLIRLEKKPRVLGNNGHGMITCFIVAEFRR